MVRPQARLTLHLLGTAPLLFSLRFFFYSCPLSIIELFIWSSGSERGPLDFGFVLWSFNRRNKLDVGYTTALRDRFHANINITFSVDLGPSWESTDRLPSFGTDLSTIAIQQLIYFLIKFIYFSRLIFEMASDAHPLLIYVIFVT